jgi:hypothetical protein
MKSTKAMKHIEKKTHQKNITDNIPTNIIATMSPVTTAIATIIHKHKPQTIPTKRKHKKLNLKITRKPINTSLVHEDDFTKLI